MSKKKKVTRSSNRVILTDTLPYETSILFSNAGLFRYLESLPNKSENDLLKKLLARTSFTLPYQYKIKHTKKRDRIISIMHPAVQRMAIELYATYAELIIYLCSKSKISLRYPSHIANRYSEKLALQHIPDHKEPLQGKNSKHTNPDETDKVASSFFAYRKFTMMYKFIDSFDFQRLEVSFSKFALLDISNCFSSIYTHSLAWAVKGKDFSKVNRHAKSFEQSFDELMQKANHDETHGILIGPEVSRVFAEIILQEVDSKVVSELAKEGLVLEKNYSIRRYVDDYFIFYNDINDFEVLQKCLAEQLSHYKMYLNENKTTYYDRPFITPESRAKIEVSDFITILFSTFPTQEDIERKHKVRRHSNEIRSRISRFKSILVNCNVKSERVIPYTLKLLLNQLKAKQQYLSFAEERDKQICHSNMVCNFLANLIEFTFYLYALDGNNSSSNSICNFVLIMDGITKQLEKADSEAIKYKFYSECLRALKSFYTNDTHPKLENLNILIVLSHSSFFSYLDERQLLSFFGLPTTCVSKECFSHFDYFSITTFIYLLDKKKWCNQNTVLISLKEALMEIIGKNFAQDAEVSMLFLDIVSCPFLSQDWRLNFFNTGCSALELVSFGTRKNFTEISSRTWFTNWNSDEKIHVTLNKKTIRSPY